jgi:hypothetical protein
MTIQLHVIIQIPIERADFACIIPIATEFSNLTLNNVFAILSTQRCEATLLYIF